MFLSGCAAGNNWSVFGDKPKVSATGKEIDRADKSGETSLTSAAEDGDVGQGVGEENTAEGIDPGEAASGMAGSVESEIIPEPLIVHQMDRQYVGKRLKKYQAKKQQWNVLAGEVVSLDRGDSWPSGWHRCVQDVEMLTFGYQRLYDALGQTAADHNSAGQSISPWQVLTKDIAYTESSCGLLQAEAKADVALEIANYASFSMVQPIDLFLQYMEKRQYAQAINTYERLIATAGETPDAEVRQEYSIALRRSGRYGDALTVVKGFMADDFTSEDALLRIASQRQYADLLLLTGDKERAKQRYEKIVNYLGDFDKYRDWAQDQMIILADDQIDLSEYQQVLKAFYRFDGTYLPSELTLEDDYVDSGEENALQRSISRLRSNAEERSLAWFKEQLSALDDLVNDQNYEQAKLMVVQLRQQSSGAMREQLVMMEEHIVQAEVFDRQNAEQLEQQSNETEWQKAVRSLENKEYDTAIRLFSGLLHGNHGEEARSYIAKASDLAASDLRRRAASLFAKARRASDPLQKERLLTESRDLLQNLLGSYPDAAIVGKAEKNLKVIEGELQQLKSPPEPMSNGEW